MSVGMIYPPTVNNLQKSLNADYTAGATTLTLNNTTYIQNAPGVCVVNRIDSGSTLQPATDWTYFAFTGTSGSTLTGVTVVAGSTDQDHATGEIVEFIADIHYAQSIIDTFNEEHNPSDGTHTDITADSLNTHTIPSGTSTLVTLAATQTLTNKTLTSPTIQGLTQGWITSTDTWTYASASSFTISGVDRTGYFSAGTKILLTQTTDKFFYVTSSSFSTNTTVNITGGTDYTLANAAITSPRYSYESSPGSFPQYFSFTPAYTNLTVGNATNSGRFCMVGKTVHCRTFLTLGSTSSVGSNVILTLPVTASSSSYGTSVPIGLVRMDDTGTASYYGRIEYESTTTGQIVVDATSGSYSVPTGISSTVPHTWASADGLYVTLEYEAA